MTASSLDELEQARQLLTEAAVALWEIAKTALTVKPSLDVPYPDAPELTPWTRWMEPRARRAHDTAMRIRKYLKQPIATREEPPS